MIHRILFFFCFISVVLQGQEANNILFSNIEPEEKILSLTLSNQYEGTYFVVGIVKNNQVIGSSAFFARTGQHHYDLRSLSAWKGKIDYLASTLPKEAIQQKALVNSSFGAEWDLFMVEEKFTPKLINFIHPKTFAGRPLNQLLILVALISTFFLFLVLKKRLIISIFIGVLIATLLMDMRQIVDHFAIQKAIKKSNPYIAPIGIPKRFIEKARPLINGPWTFEGKLSDEYYKLYFQYALADFQYTWNLKQFELPAGTFIITQNPKQNQEVILRESGFYLAKKR